MPNQNRILNTSIKAINHIAQSFIENIPGEIADQLQGHTGVECFGCHWQSFSSNDDFFVYTFTDDQPPKHGDIVFIEPFETHYKGQKNVRNIIARYFVEPRTKKATLYVEGVSHD